MSLSTHAHKTLVLILGVVAEIKERDLLSNKSYIIAWTIVTQNYTAYTLIHGSPCVVTYKTLQFPFIFDTITTYNQLLTYVIPFFKRLLDRIWKSRCFLMSPK